MLKVPKSYYVIKILIDFFTITFSFILSRYFLYIIGGPFINKAIEALLMATLFSWYLISKMLPIYDDSRNRSFSLEFTIICKAIFALNIAQGFLIYFFFNNADLPRSFILIFSFLLLICLPLERYLLRVKSAYYRKEIGRSEKKVLIVGAGFLGMQFYKTVISDRKFGYQLAGFVDDEKKEFLKGEYLGKIEDLEHIIAFHDVEEVIIALPNRAVDKIEQTIYLSERNAKRVRIIPDYYRFGSGNFKVTSLGNFPLITLRSLPLDDIENRLFKRVLDITIAILGIIFIFSWLFPVIAFLIKITSKGPVFFRQERWGLNNRKITCFKFRSMIGNGLDIDEKGKYLQATKNDKRVTKIGKFLRKTSLDELPQVINVLLGDMSFVGPRPHPIPLNIESKNVIQNYMLRHLVKPGITGWAQVNGARGETDTHDKMQKRINFDLWYIENWSIWLDFQIIAQTIINLIKGDQQAY